MTTKVCPKCNHPNTIPLPSTDEKICSSCAYVFPWPLEEGQQRTFTNTKRKPSDDTTN